MANFEIQVQVEKFLAAQLVGVQSRHICPPPLTIGELALRVQRIEFGQNRIRHDKPARFPVFYEWHGETFGINADGFQTQIAQDVVVHVTTLDDVLAHPNGPASMDVAVPVRAILDLDYFALDTQCFVQTRFVNLEWGPLPPLPPGVDPDSLKAMAHDLIGRALPSSPRPLNFANVLPGGATKVLNAGVSVSQDLTLLVFRAEVGAGSSYGDVPWGNFYKGFVSDRLRGADWGLFVESGMLEGIFTTNVWRSVGQHSSAELQLISVGSEYSNAGGKAHVDTTIHANVDLPDPAGTVYVEPTIRIELSVGQPRHLTIDVFLPDIRAIANSMLVTVRILLQALLGPMNGFAQAALDSAVGDIQVPTGTGLPNCSEVAPLHQRCTLALSTPAVGDTQVRVTDLLALPDGISLTGRLTVAPLEPSTLEVRIKEFQWTPPNISCSSADIAFVAAFAANVEQFAPVKAEVVLEHSGTTPVHICDVEVLNDPLGKFPRSGVRWDSSTLPATIVLQVPNPGPDYARAPYPVDLLVSTTLGARLVRLRPAPALTQADIDRLVALALGTVANCKLLVAPPGFNLKWHIDPPWDKRVVHNWQLVVEGLRPGDSLKLFNSAGKRLVHVNALTGIATKLSALVAPAGAKELTLVRELGAGSDEAPEVGIEIRQQLLESAAAVPLDARCRRVFASTLWSQRGLVAVLEDGLAAFDLSSPRRPQGIGRWRIEALRTAWNWPEGMLAVSEGGFFNIDIERRMTAVGPSDEPSPILDAVLGDSVVHVLTADAIEVRSLRLVPRLRVPSDGARCLLRLGRRLLVGGSAGITVYRLGDARRLEDGVQSCSELSIVGLELPVMAEDGSVLAILEDGSARSLVFDDDDRAQAVADFPEVPWFAGGTRLGDAFVHIGPGGRWLELSTSSESRTVGSDATDVIPPDLGFTDWTDIGEDRAEGELHGRRVTLSGPLGKGSVADRTFPLFDSDAFQPRLPDSDAVNLVGRSGHSFQLTFDAPVQDVVLQLASLASTIAFAPGTPLAKVSGDRTLMVSGSSVSGVAEGSMDSNGTVRVFGVFQSLEFSVTPAFADGSVPDGIYMQVGGLPA